MFLYLDRLHNFGRTAGKVCSVSFLFFLIFDEADAITPHQVDGINFLQTVFLMVIVHSDVRQCAASTFQSLHVGPLIRFRSYPDTFRAAARNRHSVELLA